MISALDGKQRKQLMQDIIDEINKRGDEVTYIYPEDTCPECGSTLPEEEIDSMLNVLFTRAQLAQIKSL